MRDPVTPWVRYGVLRSWLQGRGVSERTLKAAKREARGVRGHPLNGHLFPGAKRASYDWRAVANLFPTPLTKSQLS